MARLLRVSTLLAGSALAALFALGAVPGKAHAAPSVDDPHPPGPGGLLAEGDDPRPSGPAGEMGVCDKPSECSPLVPSTPVRSEQVARRDDGCAMTPRSPRDAGARGEFVVLTSSGGPADEYRLGIFRPPR